MAEETTDENLPELYVPSHGKGSLRRGGKPGNRGGTGRLPSAVRRAALERLDKHVPTLDAIAAGKARKGHRVTERDRIAAVRELARIGFGPGMDLREVREKLDATLAVIEQHCAPDVATQITMEIRRIWVG